jgi:hypothetical protein
MYIVRPIRNLTAMAILTKVRRKVKHFFRRNNMELIANDNGSYTVKSDSGHTYTVTHRSPYLEEDVHIWNCNCPAAQHGKDCKHIKAVIEDADKRANEFGC